VICPEFTTGLNPSIWVRLQGGILDLTDGRRIVFKPELHGQGHLAQVFLFTGEIVARCVREHREMTFDIPGPVVQMPAKNLAKAPGARTSKKRDSQHEPGSDSLFE
jgi:hypothetical protein